MRSANLAVAQRGVKAFDRLAIVVPLFTLALIATSLWLSMSRRRTLVQLLVGSSLLLIVLRRAVIYEQSALANDANNRQVALTVLGDLLHGSFILTAWLLIIAIGILVVALLTGPYRWAVSLRRFVARVWRRGVEAASGERRARSLSWMRAHADALQLVGVVVAGVLLLIVSISLWSLLIIGTLLAVYEVVLQWAKAHPPEEAPPEAGVDHQGQVADPATAGRSAPGRTRPKAAV